jgi:hypothetical protein
VGLATGKTTEKGIENAAETYAPTGTLNVTKTE